MLIIALEGPDKVGKETQSRLLCAELRRMGHRAVRAEIPSRQCSWSYGVIYWALGNGLAKRLPNIFQAVHFVNKLSFQHRVLPTLGALADVIVLDRWSLSSVIYGNATGVFLPLIMWFYRTLLQPTLTIVMSTRSYRRDALADDSYESDDDLQARVRNDYRQWALANPTDHVLVDNSLAIDDVHRSIMDAVEPFRSAHLRATKR